MRKSTKCLLLCGLMSFAAAVFVLYVLGHPEMSSPLPLKLMLLVFAVYAAVCVILFLAFVVLRLRRR